MSHDQIETRAPIRAMAFADLDGALHLLAAYLCTPLVTLPLDALTDGARVRAKTIAELGDAGTPVDIVPYRAMDMASGKTVPYVLVANLYRETSIIPLASNETANRGPGYAKPVSFGQSGGAQRMGAVMGNVLHIDDQDGHLLVALRRHLAGGQAQLVSIDKMAMFRLSDYDVSEHVFPADAYTAPMQANYIQPMQDMLKQEEGFADQVRKRLPAASCSDAAGWALQPGAEVTLAAGDATLRTWTVAAGGCAMPDPGYWAVSAPQAGTRQPLAVRFAGPIGRRSRDLLAEAEARARGWRATRSGPRASGGGPSCRRHPGRPGRPR